MYLAQFEHHHNTSGNAFRILRVGKCDGRVPKFLIKNAYQNLKENKSNLFDGVPDPWDESLHDITDTSTTANKKATTTMMFGIKLLLIVYFLFFVCVWKIMVFSKC